MLLVQNKRNSQWKVKITECSKIQMCIPGFCAAKLHTAIVIILIIIVGSPCVIMERHELVTFFRIFS